MDTAKATLNILPGVNLASKEAATEFGQASTKQFNIPILDINKMKDIFGMTDPNKALGMQEILGIEKWKKMKDVLELAEGVQQTNFGDVSEFVKRRGFLGGANDITNLINGGAILSNPFASVGLMLMAPDAVAKVYAKAGDTTLPTFKPNARLQTAVLKWFYNNNILQS